ncbi:MAG TPA: dihydrolipoamide acetyltransferase family protein [Acidimicrobiales bacterium]|nr:dihydrolipoamide acetyltransferase family protein [Acidimicrobiales bacterium]
MSVDITMPQLGETVTEGTITRWAKKVGDEVAEDEVLFEVSTDKVDSEVPSPAAGVIAEILVNEGETVDVGVRLAVIDDGAAAGAAAPEPEPDAEQPSPTPQVDGEEQAPADGSVEPAPEAPASPQAPPETGAAPPAAAPPAAAPEKTSSPAAPAGAAHDKLLSPIVRRLISEHGLDADRIVGTGSGGRITRNDVQAVIDGQGPAVAAPAPAAADGQATAAPPAAPALSAPAARAGADQVIPFSNIRRRTAEHMRRSLDTSAHTLVVVEVDYHNVEAVRLPAREQFKAIQGVSLSYLPFIARAVVDALHEFPLINASVGEDELIVHHEVNLGIAVDLSYEGLIVPVVHGADGKRLAALARDIAGLAGRARSKKLSADDISGGTFTITNPGGYGTLLTGPIINQPQVAILSTDGVKPKPVAIAVPGGGYAVAVHPLGNLALAFDHRAFDGAYASAFLARVRDTLETRDWSLELA